MNLVDSHCHINFITFKDDADQVVKDFLSDNYALIVVGSQDSTSRRAVEYADKYERGVYAAVGLHPLDLIADAEDTVVMNGVPYTFKSRQEDFDREKYRNLALSSKKVVAIGEVGLDYYYFDKYTVRQIEEYKAKQAEVFREFISLVEELDLPLIIHCRGEKQDPYGAYDDLLEIVQQEITAGHKVRGVVHCFGGSSTQAQKFLDLSLYLGFTGIITFRKKAEEIQAIVKITPWEKILIETDAPFLSPEPHRGERNLPQYVEFVCRKLAELKNATYEEAAEQTTANARALFNI